MPPPPRVGSRGFCGKYTWPEATELRPLVAVGLRAAPGLGAEPEDAARRSALGRAGHRRRPSDTRVAPALTLVDGLEGTSEVAVLAITVHLTPQRRNRHPAAAAARHLGGEEGRSGATSAPEEDLQVGRVEEEVGGC